MQLTLSEEINPRCALALAGERRQAAAARDRAEVALGEPRRLV